MNSRMLENGLDLRALFAGSDFRCDQIVIHFTVIGIIKIMIELVQHFSIGSRSQQRHHHNEQQ